VPNAITGTGMLSVSPTGYAGANSQLTPAIQTLWSKEILFQSMPILRFEQFAVKKTELGVQPGLTVNFMRYNNLPPASQLVEGVRMQTQALSATQYSIQVAEQGFAVAMSELLLNASFDDVMASASRLLGRNMAMYLDSSARDTLRSASSLLLGYQASEGTPASPNPLNLDNGVTPTAAQIAANAGSTTAQAAIYTAAGITTVGSGLPRYLLSGGYNFRYALVRDAVQHLASKNVPRLGETYVCFVDPSQSRALRDDTRWQLVTQYASPGNFMLGEIGRIEDVVFIETTQVAQFPADATSTFVGSAGAPTVHQAICIGDNAFGHAISLPVELRDGGILDFGREHALAWYSIWGWGLITDQAVLLLETN
jgi:N4-gp56 family major capsid protein